MAYETKEIILPSKGRIGGIEKVTIRNMIGADEKLIYSGVSEATIDKLIKRCILEPENVDVSALCEQDKYYIMMQIRILTFGSVYRFETRCPECNQKIQVELDLDNLEVFYADSDFEESLTLELGNSDKLTFKILTTKDIEEVNSALARLKATNDKGMQMILRLASVIETINGEYKSLTEKQKYLEELSSRYINSIWKSFGSIKLGVNMSTIITCPSCNQPAEVAVVMNQEFFRPSLDA